jgi:hypothetical protein
MNPTSEDMKDYLLANDSSLTQDLEFADNLHVFSMPDQPDLCVSIHDTGGGPSNPSYRLDYPSFQVMVRGKVSTGYLEAFALAESIKEVFRECHNEVVNATQYIGVWVYVDVTFIGWDAKRRPKFSINFNVQRTTTV